MDETEAKIDRPRGGGALMIVTGRSMGWVYQEILNVATIKHKGRIFHVLHNIQIGMCGANPIHTITHVMEDKLLFGKPLSFIGKEERFWDQKGCIDLDR